MNTENEIVYIDSDVFLNAILYDTDENEVAKRAKLFLSKIAKKEIIGITSVLTWDELVWITKKNLGKENAINKGKEFLIFPNLAFKKVTLSIINKAQDLFVKYAIGPRDAIHAACAIEHKAKAIYSFDDDFDKLSKIERKEP